MKKLILTLLFLAIATSVQAQEFSFVEIQSLRTIVQQWITNGKVLDGGGGGGVTDATYITQTLNASLSAEQATGALSTGCLGVTTTTGVLASRTLTGGSQIAISNGNCSGNPTFSITANSIGPTQIDETASYTWASSSHNFAAATVTGLGATSIVFTPDGSIAATNVQAAIQEVRDEAASGSGDLTEVTASAPITVTSGTGPIPSIACSTCETTTGAQTKVDAHVNDPTAAHAGSAISVDSATLVGTGNNVQSVFEEIDNAIVAAEVATAAHIADPSAAHAASAISVSSSTLWGIGTDLQAVLEELDDAHYCNVNPQTGTTYTFLDSDRCKLVSATNSAAQTYTLPDAAGAGFDAGWFVTVKNYGSAELSILPTTSTIDGGGSLELAAGQGATIWSDGTNYFSLVTSTSIESQTATDVFALGATVTARNSFANAARFEGDTVGTGWAIFHDPSDGLKFVCYVATVENDCNYGRKLNTGKTFSITDRNNDPIFVITESLTANLMTFPTAATRPRKSIWFGAGALSTDGTQCAAPAEVTLGTGPKTWTIICTDNNSSTIWGNVSMPDSWDGGTVTFTHVYVQTAADTGILNGDIAAQCRGNGEAVSNTWGTEVAIDDAAVVGTNSVDQTTSAAVTPAGTCAGGDVLWFQYQLDTATTTAVATLHHLGFKMEYTVSGMSD